MAKTDYSTIDYQQLLDETIRPQDDFFAHVNRRWLQTNPIPASESRWGAFLVLRDETRQQMRKIYEELEKAEVQPSSIEQQARDFYYTAMHVDDFEHEHLALLQQEFTKIDQISDSKSLSSCIGHLQRISVNAPWTVIIDGDDRDSSQHILRLVQRGLTLPDRDYYLEKNSTMVTIRKAYTSHLIKLHSFFETLAPIAQQFSDKVLEFETSLAAISRSSAALRDVEKNYNKTTYEVLQHNYANIDWPAYAAALGWQPDDKISVDQPEFLHFVNQQFTELPLDVWKIYLKWQLLGNYYGRISERFAALKFEFFGKILSGTSELLPLWKRAVMTIDSAIGEGVGKLYADRHFPESSKQQVLEIVESVRATYQKRIERLDWMAADTKQYALKKLQNVKVLIGYPDKWRDYRTLKITRSSYLQNIMNAEAFDSEYYLRRLHEPTSREDWFMHPQTVNAYHDPNRLVICFPAAILQPPFFNPQASVVVNYGGIGTVIGHELTHGFDDQGCQFDAEGNVRAWQTAEDRAAFTKRAQVIIDQADQFKVLPDVYLQGKLVVGESIADLGGVEIALEAVASLSDNTTVRQDGLTPQQLFFISYAVTECSAIREEKKREYALSDPHPDAEFRVNGILQHVDGFYKAFGITEHDALYRPPVSRAHIW